MTATIADRLTGITTSVAFKAPCRAVTFANISNLSGLQTVGGVANWTRNRRVLLAGQTDRRQNGIWNVDSGPWTRAVDFNGARDIVRGTIVAVEATAPVWAMYVVESADNPIVIGTSEITFRRLESLGQRGPQGLRGETGPRGPRGFDGEKGDPGNYLGFSLIGASADIADRPSSAADGAAWGLLLPDGVIRIFIYHADTAQWWDAGVITSPSAYAVADTIYVQGFGNDANSGSSPQTAVRTIERALELAWARGGELTTIDWSTDADVLTEGHLDLPDNCAIVAKHRTVFIRPVPGFEDRNVFRMGSGCYIEGVMIEGFRVDSLTDPTEGFGFSFRPGAVIRRVPYVHKCAVRSVPQWGLVAPPLDRVNGNPLVGRGGGVVLADGLVCSQYSIFPNIMTWGATPVTPNGIGYCARNGGLINAVNAVSMWAHKHFLALDGGQIILSACSTQFGDYTMWAEGYREIVVPGQIGIPLVVDGEAADAINDAADDIIDAMWSDLVSNGFTSGWTASDEAYTRSDGALFLRCMSWVLASGNEQPMIDFAKGLFNTVGQPVFAGDKLAAFVRSFNTMRDAINALDDIDSGTQAVVTALVAALNATLSAPTRRREPSKITAIGHTWTSVMAGVALTKIPPARNRARIKDSLRAVDSGVVVASGQDDEGNARFVGGLEIDARSGELRGAPFERASRRIATRAVIAGSF